MASIHLQTFSLVYLLFLLTCTASFLSHDEECLALFQFKQTILHQNYDAAGFQKLDSLSNTSDSDCCLSYGVVCSNNGHVIELDWSGSSLSGIINSSSTLFKLVHLQILNLSMNNFVESQIPPEIAGLKQLRSLDLSNSGFNGQIPNELSHLIQLSSLDLSGRNRLSFETTTNYTNVTLPELKVLGLSSCNLKEFPAFLRFQTKLTALSLEYNEIEGLVPDWIWNNSQETLQMFSLGNNFISGFHQHPRFLAWVRLEFFEVTYNNLQGQLPIPPQTIVAYDATNNKLTGEIPLICELKSLQLLDLSSNLMTGTLPLCLGNLSNSLLSLDLKQNNFHGPMLNTSHGCLLKKIDLSENGFSGKVSRSLANCINLEFLSLAANSFEDVFPIWLGTHPKLQVLILRSNKFYGAIQGLSSSQFLQLRIIDISNNGFSGQLPHKSFQNWNAMKSVNLSRSFAMGDMIPFNTYATFTFQYSMTLTNKGVKREYTKILNIFTAIDLSCNNFKGQIPQSLQDLHGLESLNLSNNHFTGHILPSFGNLKNLESLDLFQNGSFGSGLINGIVIGNLLYARYGDWFLERIGMRKNRWVRPLRNTRRN